MTRDRAVRLLGWFLGIGFVLFGIVETTVAIVGSDPIGFFWFPALCGGGALILLGVFRFPAPPRLSIPLVAVGALAGALATAWTLIVPVLALVLVGLVIDRPGQPAKPPAAA